MLVQFGFPLFFSFFTQSGTQTQIPPPVRHFPQLDLFGNFPHKRSQRGGTKVIPNPVKCTMKIKCNKGKGSGCNQSYFALSSGNWYEFSYSDSSDSSDSSSA